MHDASSGGAQVGGALNQTLILPGSLFTAGLDFGPGAFAGSARWLDLAVRCPAGAGGFTALSPRQEVTAVPNALFASNAGLLNGQAASAFVDLASAQDIAGVKTFSGGVKFPDGTTLTSAHNHPALPGSGAASTVDSANNVGSDTSITIGADGLGLIIYRDATLFGLKAFHCANPACSSGTAVTLDTVDGTGYYPSVAIGADGLALITYHNSNYGYLKVLHCTNVACSSSVLGTRDSAGDVGEYTSVTIGADGLALISYFDHTLGDLKVFHCDNIVHQRHRNYP